MHRSGIPLSISGIDMAKIDGDGSTVADDASANIKFIFDQRWLLLSLAYIIVSAFMLADRGGPRRRRQALPAASFSSLQ